MSRNQSDFSGGILQIYATSSPATKDSSSVSLDMPNAENTILQAFEKELMEIMGVISLIRKQAQANQDELAEMTYQMLHSQDASAEDSFQNWKLLHILPEDCGELLNRINRLINLYHDMYRDMYYKRRLGNIKIMGADQVLKSGERVPFELKQALIDGKKWTAEAYITLLEYILTIGFKPINPHYTPQEREEIISRRVRYVSGVGTELPICIEHFTNQYAELLQRVREAEALRDKIHRIEEQLQALPSEQYELFRTQTFSDAIDHLPIEVRGKYRELVLIFQTYAVNLHADTMMIQEMGIRMMTFRAEIDKLIGQCEAAFRDESHFDENAHEMMMESLNKSLNDDIIAYQSLNSRVSKLAQERHEKLLSIAQDSETALTDADTATFIDRIRKEKEEIQQFKAENLHRLN